MTTSLLNAKQFPAFLSLLTGCLVLGLKWLAYHLTGSVALYSDALESFVNIAAAGAAYVALWIAYQPADANHPYGHTKAEYFSAVLEGVLILLAAGAIIREAWERLFAPQALESTGAGMLVSVGASLLNAALAAYLIRAGKRNRSPALKADGLHILSDVVTSAGVLAGIGLAWLTGWWLLDPLLAIVVALNILWMGMRLVRESVGGLMDEGMSPEELSAVHQAIQAQMRGTLQVHKIKTRRAGHLVFVEFHMVVPGEMSVEEAHLICDRIETSVQACEPGALINIHVEPENHAEEHGFILRG